ncbi:MAG: DUF4372 domain-containing protein [Inquilinus sp.]|nr:DUF4372 domain-containing protein [Inquilinus sp.]
MFGQVLKLVPRYELDTLGADHHKGRKLRVMTRWNQFVALSFGPLAGDQKINSAGSSKLYETAVSLTR